MQVGKITDENEWEGRNFLKMRFQNHWEGYQFWRPMSIFPSVFKGYFLGFSHLPFIFTLDSEVGLIGHCENVVRYARPQKYLVNFMGGVKIPKKKH